jgi:hypothetical protein
MPDRVPHPPFVDPMGWLHPVISLRDVLRAAILSHLACGMIGRLMTLSCHMFSHSYEHQKNWFMGKMGWFILVWYFSIPMLWSQVDTVFFDQDQVLFGEIKDLNQGILRVKTSYGEGDFQVEWREVRGMVTQTRFLITLSNGEVFNGRLQGFDPAAINLVTDERGIVPVSRNDIVFLKPIEEGFADQLYFSVALGFNLARANNLRQFTSRTRFGYLARRWDIDGSLNGLQSVQNDTNFVRRYDGGLKYTQVLRHGWLLFQELDFLNSTELRLRLRTLAKIGAGKFIFRTNKFHWTVFAGPSFNFENFQGDSPDKRSVEGFVGTDVNIFDAEDISLKSQWLVYLGFTESRRWRTDFRFDIKYDLPLDFFLNLGFTLNFDNQPVESATRLDYVLDFTFGWEW